MILTKEVKTKWVNTNKEHYISKGYEYTKNFNELIVKVDDLPPTSGVDVLVQCETCGEQKILKYRDYNKIITNTGVYQCHHCVLKRIAKNRITPIEDIRDMFNDLGLILISTEYIPDTKLLYKCPNHPDIIQEKRFDDLKRGTGCYWCGKDSMAKKQSGDKSHFYIDGRSSLNYWARKTLLPWKVDSLKQTNFKCDITGTKEKSHVHHLFCSFPILLNKTLVELELPIHECMSEYSEDELDIIETNLLKNHYDAGLGIPITASLHRTFHNYYGYNNTENQYKEFKQKYKDGEFN